MTVKFKGREVVGVEIDGLDPKDCPDFCDAYIASATWKDTGKELTEQELEDLTETGLANEIACEIGPEMLASRAYDLYKGG